MKFAHDKINDFIHFVEDHRNDECYKTFFQQTMVNIEQSEELDSPPRKRCRGRQINYKHTYFEIIDNILVSMRERFACIQEFAFFELIDVNRFELFAQFSYATCQCFAK